MLKVTCLFNSVRTWDDDVLDIGAYRLENFKYDYKTKTIKRKQSRVFICQPWDRPSIHWYLNAKTDGVKPHLHNLGWIDMFWTEVSEGKELEYKVPYLSKFFYNARDDLYKVNGENIELKNFPKSHRIKDIFPFLTALNPKKEYSDIVMSVLLLIAQYLKTNAVVLEDSAQITETGYELKFNVFKAPHTTYYNRFGFINLTAGKIKLDDHLYTPDENFPTSVDEAVILGNRRIQEYTHKTEQICNTIDPICQTVTNYFQKGISISQQQQYANKIREQYSKNIPKKDQLSNFNYLLFRLDQTSCTRCNKNTGHFYKASLRADFHITNINRQFQPQLKITLHDPPTVPGSVADFLSNDITSFLETHTLPSFPDARISQ